MNDPTTPPRAPRDSQRSAVYSAEDEVALILSRGGSIEHFGSTFTLPPERKFGDVDSVGPYLRAVLQFAPIAALPRSTVPVSVRARRGVSRAHYEADTATIAIPPYELGSGEERGWALREMVVLHELAHHLLGEPGHGPDYAAMMLHLVEHVIAPEAAHLLRVALWERGARIAPAPLRWPSTGAGATSGTSNGRDSE